MLSMFKTILFSTRCCNVIIFNSFHQLYVKLICSFGLNTGITGISNRR